MAVTGLCWPATSGDPAKGMGVSFEGMDFETRAVHVGSEPDPATGAVVPPIYQTSITVLQTLAPGDHLATRTAAR
jgi:cystathionine beta-lyase/cystathionine gamma-synthase